MEERWRRSDWWRRCWRRQRSGKHRLILFDIHCGWCSVLAQMSYHVVWNESLNWLHNVFGLL
jgi:hypothetical protein